MKLIAVLLMFFALNLFASSEVQVEKPDPNLDLSNGKLIDYTKFKLHPDMIRQLIEPFQKWKEFVEDEKNETKIKEAQALAAPVMQKLAPIGYALIDSLKSFDSEKQDLGHKLNERVAWNEASVYFGIFTQRNNPKSLKYQIKMWFHYDDDGKPQAQVTQILEIH